MAMPASKLEFELEDPLDSIIVLERVAKLETNVEHIRSDVAELKTDVRRMNEKIDSVDQRLTGKIDSLLQAVADLKLGRAFDRVGWLLMSAALLGVMARAFNRLMKNAVHEASFLP